MLVILGATHPDSHVALAPLAVGLCLTLVHLVGIPVTNTSVNPARSTGPAVFVGGWALAQLWMFWVAPILGGLLGGFAWKYLLAPPPGDIERREPETVRAPPFEPSAAPT